MNFWVPIEVEVGLPLPGAILDEADYRKWSHLRWFPEDKVPPPPKIFPRLLWGESTSSHHKEVSNQRGTLMFSVLSATTSCWANSRVTGDLTSHGTHMMPQWFYFPDCVLSSSSPNPGTYAVGSNPVQITCPTGEILGQESYGTGITTVTLVCSYDGWHVGSATGKLVTQEPRCIREWHLCDFTETEITIDILMKIISCHWTISGASDENFFKKWRRLRFSDGDIILT